MRVLKEDVHTFTRQLLDSSISIVNSSNQLDLTLKVVECDVPINLEFKLNSWKERRLSHG